MLRTNKDKLPVISVQGTVWHPKGHERPRPAADGTVSWVTGTGGIVYNAQIGDCCMDWAADHLEPGVTTRNKDDRFNDAYNMLSCIGNEATVKSGDAKGDRGFVTGKHGGSEHLIIYFPAETLEKLNIDDTIGVKATGQGLELLDYPDIKIRNMSPELLDKMNIKEEDNALKVGVAKIVPACIMGSGLGMIGTATGDCDITLFCQETMDEYGLRDLRFGDIVAITDADQRFGRSYRKGAVSIGVVIHGNSAVAGHGPGVTTLMSTIENKFIVPVIDKKANLADYFLS